MGKLATAWLRSAWRLLWRDDAPAFEYTPEQRKSFADANDSLMGWLLIMNRGHQIQIEELRHIEEYVGVLDSEEEERLRIATIFCEEIEDLAVWLADHPEGEWVRLQKLVDHTEVRRLLFEQDPAQELRAAVLMSLESRFRGVIVSLPPAAR